MRERYDSRWHRTTHFPGIEASGPSFDDPRVLADVRERLDHIPETDPAVATDQQENTTNLDNPYTSEEDRRLEALTILGGGGGVGGLTWIGLTAATEISTDAIAMMSTGSGVGAGIALAGMYTAIRHLDRRSQ
ncbi:MAG: hypothetical protein ACI9T8_000354 [Candidatus Saccharimonadales bacterium]|jgi:hypothetical protein